MGARQSRKPFPSRPAVVGMAMLTFALKVFGASVPTDMVAGQRFESARRRSLSYSLRRPSPQAIPRLGSSRDDNGRYTAIRNGLISFYESAANTRFLA